MATVTPIIRQSRHGSRIRAFVPSLPQKSDSPIHVDSQTQTGCPLPKTLRISMSAPVAKHIVVSIIAAILVLSVLSWFPSPEPDDIGGFFVDCVLCWFLFKGKNWARWALIVSMALGGTMGVIAITSGQFGIEKFSVLNAMSFAYLALAGLLTFSKTVASYFAPSSLGISMGTPVAKHIVVSIIAAILVLSVLSWFPSPEPKDIGRFFVNCVLCWFLFKGKNWARWVLIVSLALGGTMGAIAIASGQFGIEKFIVLYVMSFAYLASAGLLAFSKTVTSYFAPSSIQVNS